MEKNIVNQISDKDLTKLRDAGVAEDDISSLCQQVEAYNPTKTQVENYVNGLIENKADELKETNVPIDYEKTENGDTITPYGIIPYQDLAKKWEDAPELKAVSTLSNRIVSGDQSGVYYVINSTAGYNQLTSFVTLPTLSTVNSVDRPYQFFGFSTSNGSASAYGDIGLVYFPATSLWKGFYNVVEGGTRYENYTFNFTGGSSIYFHLQIYTNKAVLIIRNPSSWAEVGRVEYTFHTSCVPSNFSTVKLSKQVTLAQHNGGTLNITTGTKMNNANYSESWLYTPNTNYSFSSTYCSEAYRQGPTAAAYGKISASYTAWTTDTVTISFN
jgi:hypothetical protein